MAELYGSDAFSPGEIAKHIESVGVAKARLPFLQTAMLGVLAGAFIGLGSLYFVLVASDATLGFAAAGFEHSIANMYFFALALLLKGAGVPLPPGGEAITIGAMFLNLGPVIAGNIVGGSVLVALVYWVIYLRNRPARD